MSDCNQAMVRAVDEEHLLREVCAILVSTGHYRFAWVNYLDGGDGPYTSHPAAQAGYDDGYLDAIRAIRREHPDLPPGPSRRAVRANQPQIVRDISTDPLYIPWREATLARGYRSMIALPLAVNQQPFGALNIYATEPNAFDDQEIMLLVELASDLAYGIVALRTRLERRQALEQLQEANARLEKRHTELLALQEIAHALISTLDLQQIYEVMYREVAQRLLGAQHLLIALYDAAHGQIVCDFAVIDGVPYDAAQLPPVPFGTGPNSETIRTRQPRIVVLPTEHNTVTLPGTYTRV
ncbi:MAG: GAF domain-containing protein, partial [Chloroflexi bacterium]